MRYIQKSELPPASIREWRQAQEHLGINLDYPSFTRKRELRTELIAEQLGLCAYTGTPLDDRLGGYQAVDQNLAFQPHIEHIKPRAVCQKELESQGGVYGSEICEDLDHHNLVAALEVKRKPPARAEIFGAAAHEDALLPVTPVQPDCENRFRYAGNGDVSGADPAAIATIAALKLDHPTLQGWRRGAVDGFFPLDEVLTRDEIEQRIAVLTQASDGRLPEFSFCIRSYAQSLLG